MESRRETLHMDRAERWPALRGVARDLPDAAHVDADRGQSPLLEFFQSTYEAGATLGQWDCEALERGMG